jgi:hypothetical protein
MTGLTHCLSLKTYTRNRPEALSPRTSVSPVQAKPGASSCGCGLLGVDVASEIASTGWINPGWIAPDAGVVNTGEYGPYDTTGMPLGSDAFVTSRTARTRHWMTFASCAWNVHGSRSSATLVRVMKLAR